MKWGWFLNVDCIAVVVLIIAVLYAYFFLDRSKGKIRYQGYGQDGWDVRGWEGEVEEPRVISKPKPKRKAVFNKSEERCRTIFERIYGSKFKSCRPDWLKNPVTGKNLELDGFCEGINTPIGNGLAFEYDGIQHSKYKPHFHRGGKDEFEYQVKKDSWKDLKCKERGVMLIRIPHFVAFEDLERYITEKLRKYKVYKKTGSGFYD